MRRRSEKYRMTTKETQNTIEGFIYQKEIMKITFGKHYTKKISRHFLTT